LPAFLAGIRTTSERSRTSSGDLPDAAAAVNAGQPRVVVRLSRSKAGQRSRSLSESRVISSDTRQSLGKSNRFDRARTSASSDTSHADVASCRPGLTADQPYRIQSTPVRSFHSIGWRFQTPMGVLQSAQSGDRTRDNCGRSSVAPARREGTSPFGRYIAPRRDVKAGSL
jgi:hypothetical protein